MIHQRRRKVVKRRGFTLIELLVVIAIIAILAAILFPVFAKARDKARSIVCLSNVKSISLAIQMYLSDWEDTFPIYNDYHGGRWWGVALDPYIRNATMWKCPAIGSNQGTNQYGGVGMPYDYSANADLFGHKAPYVDPNTANYSVDVNDGYDDGIQAPGGGGGSGGGPHGAYSMNNFGLSDPANVPCVFDTGTAFTLGTMGGVIADDFYSKSSFRGWYLWSPVEGTETGTIIIQGYLLWNFSGSGGLRSNPYIVVWELQWRRHQGGINIGFCDGHAKWMGNFKNWGPDWMQGTASVNTSFANDTRYFPSVGADTRDKYHYWVSNSCPANKVNWWPHTFIN